MKAVTDLVTLENFLMYLSDKTDGVYQNEVDQAIKRFLLEEVTTITHRDSVE